MNKHLLNKICIVTILLFTFSCKKDEPTQPSTTIDKQKLSAKWIVEGAKSDIQSIELTKDGNYIVEANVKSDVGSRRFIQPTLSFLPFKAAVPRPSKTARSSSLLSPVHFGTYEIEGNRIKLAGFGLIEEITLTPESFSFSFTMEQTGSRNQYVAKKKEPVIASSTRTDLLCRTWVIDKFSLDIQKIPASEIQHYKSVYGDNWQAKAEKEYTDEGRGTIVLLSRSGTYLVLDPNTGENEDAGLAEWKWINSEENSFYFSWDNWSDDWEEYPVKIEELNNTTLRVEESGHITHLTIKPSL